FRVNKAAPRGIEEAEGDSQSNDEPRNFFLLCVFHVPLKLFAKRSDLEARQFRFRPRLSAVLSLECTCPVFAAES
ncbi:hypothetical protein N4G37_13445, partial [Enterococcus faecalis]